MKVKGESGILPINHYPLLTLRPRPLSRKHIARWLRNSRKKQYN